jgi:hypothetical protein
LCRVPLPPPAMPAAPRKIPAGFGSWGEYLAANRVKRGVCKTSRVHTHLNALAEGQRVTHAAVAAAHDEVRGARTDVVGLRDALTGRVARRPDQSAEDRLAEMVISDAAEILEKKTLRAEVAAGKKRKREADKAEKEAEKHAEKVDKEAEKKLKAAASKAEKPEKTKKKKQPPTKEQVETNEAGLSLAFRRGAGVDESNKEAEKPEDVPVETEKLEDVPVEADEPADALEEAPVEKEKPVETEKPADALEEAPVETEKPADALEEAEKPVDVPVETEKPVDALEEVETEKKHKKDKKERKEGKEKKDKKDKKEKKPRSFVDRLLFRVGDNPTDSTDMDEDAEEKEAVADDGEKKKPAEDEELTQKKAAEDGEKTNPEGEEPVEEEPDSPMGLWCGTGDDPDIAQA